MVFERKHIKVDGAIAGVSGIVDNYNNTNASGYINRIRIRQIKEMQGDGTIRHNDPPPEPRK